MISDVPGLHLGHGARRGPGRRQVLLHRHRTSSTASAGPCRLDDKPFYWLGPDGRQKVLCWVPYMGYAAGPRLLQAGPRRCRSASCNSKRRAIPTTSCNCAGTCGDNGPPDADAARPGEELERQARLSRRWSSPPRSEMFREFEKRYGDKTARLPRRLDAVLGGRGRLVGPRNGHQPHRRRAARAGRNPLGDARPGRRIRPSSSPPPGAT